MPGFNESIELTWLDNNGDSVLMFGCPVDPAIGVADSGGVGGRRPTCSYKGIRGLDRGNPNIDYTTLTDTGHPEGILYWRSQTKIEEVSDGLSNTLLVGEHPASQADGYLPAGDWGWWYTSTTENYEGALWPDDVLYGVTAFSSHYGFSPTYGSCPNPPYFYRAPLNQKTVCNYDWFWSYHSGGANFIYADGSVHFLPYTARPVMVPMATRNKGDSIPDY